MVLVIHPFALIYCNRSGHFFIVQDAFKIVPHFQGDLEQPQSRLFTDFFGVSVPVVQDKSPYTSIFYFFLFF